MQFGMVAARQSGCLVNQENVMALDFASKQALVAEVKSVAAEAQSAVAAEYRGLTVAEMTELRANARSSDVYMKVVKNTLARRAIEGTGFFERGPGIRSESRQEFCEGSREARHRIGFDRWAAVRSVRSRPACGTADAR